MDLFDLPHSARVSRVIPKKMFDAYTTAKQKKQITEQISRITWVYKLSPDTINLDAKEIKEIQVFKVELKEKKNIQPLLDIIDKAIPYNIIFIVEFAERVYLSTSTKHQNPSNADNAVLDCTFKSEWLDREENPYKITLTKNLDTVYHDFCLQLSAKIMTGNQSLASLVQVKQQEDLLKKEIEQLKRNIRTSKHYKVKVELNVRLRQKTNELKRLGSS